MAKGRAQRGSSNVKPLVVGAGVLDAGIFAYSAFASAKSNEEGTGPAVPPPTDLNVGRDAAQADAYFAAALTAGGPALIAATHGAATPYVASIGAAVTASWQSLSQGEKANVWRGKVKS